MPPRITILSRSDDARLAVARAFDSAPEEWEVDLLDDVPAGTDVVVLGEDLEEEPARGRGLPVVRFDPRRPAEVISEIKTKLRSPARSYVVTGACGGVGATSVAVHLAARWSPSCLLVELAQDQGPSKTGLRLGVPSLQPAHLEEAGPVACAAGFALTSVLPSEDIASRIELWESEFGRIVFTCGAGNAADLGRLSRAVVCVVTPTPAGAERARWLIERLDETPVALVLNRTGRGGETSRSEVQAVVGRRINLELPVTPRLRDAEDGGRLVGAWSRWSNGVARLRAALDRI